MVIAPPANKQVHREQTQSAWWLARLAHHFSNWGSHLCIVTCAMVNSWVRFTHSYGDGQATMFIGNHLMANMKIVGFQRWLDDRNSYTIYREPYIMVWPWDVWLWAPEVNELAMPSDSIELAWVNGRIENATKMQWFSIISSLFFSFGGPSSISGVYPFIYLWDVQQAVEFQSIHHYLLSQLLFKATKNIPLAKPFLMVNSLISPSI